MVPCEQSRLRSSSQSHLRSSRRRSKVALLAGYRDGTCRIQIMLNGTMGEWVLRSWENEIVLIVLLFNILFLFLLHGCERWATYKDQAKKSKL